MVALRDMSKAVQMVVEKVDLTVIDMAVQLVVRRGK